MSNPSEHMLGTLKKFYEIPVMPFEEWRTIDQRLVRALYLRGWIEFYRISWMRTSKLGCAAYESYLANPTTLFRKHPEAPVFRIYRQVARGRGNE